MVTIGIRTASKSLHRQVDWSHLPRIGEAVSLGWKLDDAIGTVRVVDVFHDVDGGVEVCLGTHDLDDCAVDYLSASGWTVVAMPGA